MNVHYGEIVFTASAEKTNDFQSMLNIIVHAMEYQSSLLMKMYQKGGILITIMLKRVIALFPMKGPTKKNCVISMIAIEQFMKNYSNVTGCFTMK